MKRKIRPEILNSKTYKIKTPCGNLYLRFGYDERGNLFEVFATMGKSGNCVYSHLEAVSRLLCDIFKYDGTDIEDKRHAIEHLFNINCGNVWITKGIKYVSCLDLIAKKTLEELNAKREETPT